MTRFAGRAVDVRQLREQAKTVANALRPLQPADRAHVGFAFGEQRSAFAAALFGAWTAGFGATLPADARRELVVPSLRRPGTGVLLHDTGVGRGLDVPALLRETLIAHTPLLEDVSDLAASNVAVTTIGRRACHTRCARSARGLNGFSEFLVRTWTAQDLLTELEHLARDVDWPAKGVVVSTVAPSSTPGVLLGVLLPLRRGLAFSDAVPLCPEDVAHEIRASGACVLVSSPGHLRRIVKLPRGALAGLDCIESTWDALDDGLREELEHRHGVRVHTVLGPETAPVESASARELRDGLLHTEGVQDSIVVEHEQIRAAIVHAPTVNRAALERALTTRGLHMPMHMAWSERLPRDPNGAADVDAAWRHFGLDAAGRALALDLAWGERGSGAAGTFGVRIPSDSRWFDGHFPGSPILAGGVQLQEIVLPALRRLVGGDVRVRMWGALKFQTRILPGDQLQVEFTAASAQNRIAFAIRRGGETCTSGSLHFDRADAGSATP